MIVNKPIGSVKINGIISRLSVGQPVPQNILDYWKKTKQLAGLKKAGIISDGSEGKDSDNIEGKDSEEDKKDIKPDDSVHEIKE